VRGLFFLSSRDGSFAVLGVNLRFVAVMAAGSVGGTVLGGLLLGIIPDLVLVPVLAALLLLSAIKLAGTPRNKFSLRLPAGNTSVHGHAAVGSEFNRARIEQCRDA
jgi:uncharacterized membrane protein YfcA